MVTTKELDVPIDRTLDVTDTFPHVLEEPILTELVCRFTANIPEEETADLVRACFQIELAHWFFVDHYCQPDSEYEVYRHIPFNVFALQMFDHTPYLRGHITDFEKALSDFRAYKNKVPVYGTILLTEDMEEVLLVQGFRNQWGFPKGKINKEEDEFLCAVREVMEETGYNAAHLINPNHYIESAQNERVTRLYIAVGVDRDFAFHPHTAYEIKEISWFSLDELPDNKKDTAVTPREGYSNSNFYTVFPYVRRLKRWINDKITGMNKIDHFKVDPQAKSNEIQFPNFPLRPVFLGTPFSTIGPLIEPISPMHSSTPVKPENFHRNIELCDVEMAQESMDVVDSKLTVVTEAGRLSTLFVASTDFEMLELEVSMGSDSEASDEAECEDDFFIGRGASAWLNFKLDFGKMLNPWIQTLPSESEED